MSIQSYRDLLAWQRSMDVVEGTYQLTREWPKDEIYGLTNQIRRAAVSVPANIAEGQGRIGSKEFVHHLSIANGSLYEVQTLLLVAQRLSYSDETMCHELMGKTVEVARLLRGLIKSLQ